MPATPLKSDIKITVELDENRVPEKLSWTARDGGVVNQESKAVMLSVWDSKAQESMRIDLWTKDMPVDEMKRFYIECVGGIAQSVLSATGDEQMANEINALCDRLVELVKQEKK